MKTETTLAVLVIAITILTSVFFFMWLQKLGPKKVCTGTCIKDSNPDLAFAGGWTTNPSKHPSA